MVSVEWHCTSPIPLSCSAKHTNTCWPVENRIRWMASRNHVLGLPCPIWGWVSSSKWFCNLERMGRRECIGFRVSEFMPHYLACGEYVLGQVCYRLPWKWVFMRWVCEPRYSDLSKISKKWEIYAFLSCVLGLSVTLLSDWFLLTCSV